jgi:2-polyprenyl-3-methyl-5-hydroxy-6-metoxy-1,4-benzoquinol methylase
MTDGVESSVATRAGGPAATRRRRVGDTVAIPGDYQYRALTSGPRPQRFWHDTKRWLVESYLRPNATHRALDVGCGSGVVTAALADAGVAECIGVDGSADAIAHATARYQRPNLKYVRGLVDELEFEDGSFDLVCCMELIEHLYPEQGRALLADLYRLTRPGGRLLITTPNYRSLWPFIEWTLDRLSFTTQLADEQHVASYTHERLRRSWEPAGWRALHRHTACTLAPWIAAASWRLAEWTRRVEGRLPVGTILVHVLEKPADGAGEATRRLSS